MGLYATAEQVLDYLLDSDLETTPSGAALERVIEHAERDVDRMLGPIPMLVTGRKLNPPLLAPAQQDALARAVGAAIEFRLAIGTEGITGEDDYVPSGEVTVLRRAGRPPGPRALEELAGFGLIRRSGTALPDPPAA